jgi:hypothetical protein
VAEEEGEDDGEGAVEEQKKQYFPAMLDPFVCTCDSQQKRKFYMVYEL